MTEVRLMNMNSILTNYGFRGGEFNRIESMAHTTKMDATLTAKIGRIEQRASIDTPEEFITAA